MHAGPPSRPGDRSPLRAITGFHQDELGDWVAELCCAHRQHVRHRPPFWSRPWVLTAEGRAEKIGARLPCVLCERFEWPATVRAYKRTPDFDAATIPGALKQNHATKRGVWARIHILEGRLRYVVNPPLACERLLEPGQDGVIVPEILHRVEADGDVRFFVEFHRRDES